VLTDPLLQIEIGRLTIERGVEVTIEGIQTVGTWNQTEGANWPTHPHVAVAGFKNKDGDSLFNNNNVYHHRRDHQDASGIPLQVKKSSTILPTDHWTKRRASATEWSDN